ncbi:MAG: STAS domain-containing protein [Wenzhouxiangella sp.]|jgi:ABC-type transporter Mla MlaB component|nr:STAS domain-containing protein [Wenzhouxiangella sp.]
MSDDKDIVRLEGILAAHEVAELERRYSDRFDSANPPAAVDLADVESGDSSALALLLEWQSRAAQKIRFEKPPESLRVIARLTGVAPLLGWANEDSNAESAKE